MIFSKDFENTNHYGSCSLEFEFYRIGLNFLVYIWDFKSNKISAFTHGFYQYEAASARVGG